MDLRSPIKKKKRSGIISPTSLFTFISDNLDAKEMNSPVKNEVAKNKNSICWKPPLKANSEDSGLQNNSLHNQLPTDNYIQKEDTLSNSEPNFNMASFNCLQNRVQFNTQSPCTGAESYGGNLSIECKDNIIGNDVINENNFIRSQVSENIPEISNGENSHSEPLDMDRSFESLAYLEHCIDREERVSTEVCGSASSYLELNNDTVFTDSQTNRIVQSSELAKAEKYASNTGQVEGKAPDQFQLNKEALSPSQFPSNLENHSFDEEGNKLNNSSISNNSNLELEKISNVQQAKESHTSQQDQVIIIDKIYDNLPLKANLSYGNVLADGKHEQKLFSRGKNCNEGDEVEKNNFPSQEDFMAITNHRTNPELRNNRDSKIISPDYRDPFEATLSNSQFLRLETEISAKDPEKFDQPGFTIDKETSYFGRQIEWQKTIIRRMINEVDELNKAVMKATTAIKTQHKGLRK